MMGSFGVCGIVGVQLKAQGWDYYLLGEHLAAEYAGVYVRNRAVQIFCHLMADNQVVIVSDAADVLVLTQPTDFKHKYDVLQVKKHSETLNKEYLGFRVWGLVAECKTCNFYVSWDFSGFLIKTS